jgi:hypothetical protein
MVPVSGSAYTYVVFGEIIADYRLGINHGILCRKYHCCYIVELFYRIARKWWSLPQWVQMDFLSASRDLMMPQP